MNWTTEQILALAPDATSASAAQSLTRPAKWQSLGSDDAAAWGLCQGSGAKPYQVRIDLSEPAFKCSCPSRKFPCKHGLALLLLLAEQSSQFRHTGAPDWVAEWLAGRSARAAKREAKTASEAHRDDAARNDSKSEEARAKTAERRRERVAEGVAELSRWLEDLVRAGVGNVSAKEPAYWANAAARMIDAQAPGLARLIREMSVIPALGAGWHARMVRAAARLYLLLEAYRRLETLPLGVQEDIRSLVGWTQDQQELLELPGVADRWLVLGQRTEMDDRLQVQRTWLTGEQTGRRALVLAFAYGSQAPYSGLIAGTVLTGELVFFPGTVPPRALVKTRAEATTEIVPFCVSSIAAELTGWTSQVAECPWLARMPFIVSAVVPTRSPGGWSLLEEDGGQVPLHPRFPQIWKLAALSGGHPVAVFGEYDGEFVTPVSVMAEGRFTQLEEGGAGSGSE